MRINFIGEVIGGELKTHEDKESLQAKWFDIDEVVNSRIPLRFAVCTTRVAISCHVYKSQFCNARKLCYGQYFHSARTCLRRAA